ncbi:MAG: hypothetical protein CM15mP68_8140 [Pseudomonadota bacterium]|nr:MAG: hypothetical protein CM15mP68_8140 [Pseudomonadota bacterium]
MFKIKIFVSIITFSILLIVTSIIKNQTRETEKKILNLSKIIKIKEKDLNESQLDFSYLSSPLIIHDKIKLIDNEKYVTMEYSKIFLSMSSFLDLQNKLVIQRNQNEIKKK